MRSCESMEALPVINRIRTAIPFVLSAVCLLFLTLVVARAQVTTADIVGSVTDPSGAAVVKARI
jgi:hypothetical protein